ncbi:hypothetical protein [Gayadomonas joobiniege]|uniref:hypothetical protein n=1 Tax=Gayadomonas joobiniege TaxID=1234606 RepID=UPI000379F865|nr:hypothetical protein [Gayadomonas joobiniege]
MIKQILSAAVLFAVTLTSLADVAVTVTDDALILNDQVCEYGRGRTVADELERQIVLNFMQFLTRDNLLKVAEQTAKTKDLIAAIKPEAVRDALVNNQLALSNQKTFFQGSDTCLMAQLVLSPANMVQTETENGVWQLPEVLFVYAQGQARIENPAAAYAAQQDAVINGLRKSLNLIEQKSPEILSFLKQYQQAEFNALATQALAEQDLSALLISQQSLLNYQDEKNVYSHLLVSIGSNELKQRFLAMINTVAESQLVLQASPLSLQQALRQLLTKQGITITEQRQMGRLQLTANSKMISVSRGYQALVELQLLDDKGNQLWGWQNQPSLMTVSNNTDSQLQQLLMAHLSLPDNQQTIIQQLDQALFRQALKNISRE